MWDETSQKFPKRGSDIKALRQCKFELSVLPNSTWAIHIRAHKCPPLLSTTYPCVRALSVDPHRNYTQGPLRAWFQRDVYSCKPHFPWSLPLELRQAHHLHIFAHRAVIGAILLWHLKRWIWRANRFTFIRLMHAVGCGCNIVSEYLLLTGGPGGTQSF